MSEKFPCIVHPFSKGPATIQQLTHDLGDQVCAIFQPRADDKSSTQIDAIDKPGRYLISVLGKLQWLEAHTA